MSDEDYAALNDAVEIGRAKAEGPRGREVAGMTNGSSNRCGAPELLLLYRSLNVAVAEANAMHWQRPVGVKVVEVR